MPKTYIPPEEVGPYSRVPKFVHEGRVRQIEMMEELCLQDNGIAYAGYPSMIFVGDDAYISYDVAPFDIKTSDLKFGHSLKFRMLPKAWFYEAEQ